MNNVQATHLHPVEDAKALEGRLRLFLQNPRKILRRYIHPGMTVLDLGCGNGYFTLEMARLLDKRGKVIAADVQKGMLEILKKKLHDSELQQQIQICHSREDSLGLTEKVDFIFAFYSFHEMRFIDNIISELPEIAGPEIRILISEQKFHVSKSTFDAIIKKLEKKGFEICEKPSVFLSRTVIMKPHD